MNPGTSPRRFDRRFEALFELCDAASEAEHDVRDGFDAETVDEQWERVVLLVGGSVQAELLVIEMHNAGWISVTRNDLSIDCSTGSRAFTSTAYAGLTAAGLRVAEQNGWEDTDDERIVHEEDPPPSDRRDVFEDAAGRSAR